jgi:hypothetical protein
MAPERARGGAYAFPADVWALGLTLLECATGAYPYDAAAGPLALLLQVADDKPPCLPPGGHFSPELASFVGACLRKAPGERPTAEALARHPFVVGGGNNAPVPRGMQAVRATAAAARSRSPSPGGGRDGADDGSPPPSARCSSPRLAIAGATSPRPTLAAALVAARSLFAARSLPTHPARTAALAPLYDARATLTLEGRPPVSGARTVLASLETVAAAAASLGSAAPALVALDALELPNGTFLVLATGTVPRPAPGPLAAAAGALRGPPRAASDALTLAPCARTGELRIVAHVVRTHADA